MACPTTKEAASEHSQSTAAAISSGLPIRPIGEKVDHFHLVSLAGIHRFQGGKKLIYRKMNLDDLQLFADTRTEAHLVRSFRAGDKDVASPDLPGHPSFANIALAELR
jgi:hypothetical protein